MRKYGAFEVEKAVYEKHMDQAQITDLAHEDIDAERVVIRFGTTEVYPKRVDAAGLAALADYLGGSDVLIHVSLGTGDAAATVWGCDLTEGYIKENAYYTT